MTQYRNITALGSSFAAGPGIEPLEDANAMRSSRNYAHLLAAQLGAQVTDRSVSGATTATILHTAQQTMSGVEFPPQLDGMPADTDLVTITAGGNDLQFAGSMLYTAWSRFQPDSPMVTLLADGFAAGIPEPTEESCDAVAHGLAAIVEEVRHRASRARIILVDYLTVIDRDAPTSTFSPSERASFLRIQEALAVGYDLAAARSGAELLKVSELSIGHGLGSVEPWVFDFQPEFDRTGSSFHPNEVGMSAIADALAQQLEHPPLAPRRPRA